MSSSGRHTLTVLLAVAGAIAVGCPAHPVAAQDNAVNTKTESKPTAKKDAAKKDTKAAKPAAKKTETSKAAASPNTKASASSAPQPLATVPLPTARPPVMSTASASADGGRLDKLRSAIAAPVAAGFTPPIPSALMPTAAAPITPPAQIPGQVPATAAQPAPKLPQFAALPPADRAPPQAESRAPSVSETDLATVKRALEHIRKGESTAATKLEDEISDPSARKLVEWLILRSDNNGVDSPRYAAFAAANPNWPSVVMLRRRAESMMWFERPEAAKARAFFTHHKPMSPKGNFVLARALLTQGDRAGAANYVRQAWRSENFPADLETQARDTFGDLITVADDKARMDHRLYAEDGETAMRSANRLGGVQLALAKACVGVIGKVDNAKHLLEAVPAEARNDPLFIFCKAQWLRRQDKIAEAGELMLTAPRDPTLLRSLDDWWIERRLLARKLLDIGDPKTAYLIASHAATPQKELLRGDCHFTAGWIALRFLNDPTSAAQHFAHIADGTRHPTTLARASYWLGRTADAAGRPREARAHYETAARYSASYYGQIARAHLGLPELGLRPLPALSAEQRASLRMHDIVRGVETLYALGERDLVAVMMAELGDKSEEAGVLQMVGELGIKYQDARGLALMGRYALGRGFSVEHFAFPTVGLPQYTSIGLPVEHALAYSIARQESGFNPKIVSSANAMGLMQVTPEAGKHIAKKYNVTYDQKRLLSDQVYNLQIGAAELGENLQNYRGSYIMAFAAYNAGSGRVRDWVARYGDPRDPAVDPIDWVERIPFTETRNYVQRVLENLQIYRVKFGGSTKLMMGADLRRGAAGAN
jgi:soluble lytic murein transglycosylase